MPDLLACPNVNDTIALPLVPPRGGQAVMCRYTVDRFLGAGQFGFVLRCRQVAAAPEGKLSNKIYSAVPRSAESEVCNDGGHVESNENISKQRSSSLAAIAPDESCFPKNVALKWIACPHADNQSFGKLVREVSVLQRIGAHPHVVHLHHAWCSLKHRTLAIVLEYCAGGDLKAYLQQFRTPISKGRRRPRQGSGGAPATPSSETRRGVSGAATQKAAVGAKEVTDLNDGKGCGPQLAWTLPQATAQELTRQVAEGMLFIWSKGCVHRDLKPANILLAARPGEPLVAKVADFGFAKQLSASSSSTEVLCNGLNQSMAASQVGTPLYAAPEVGVGCTLPTRTKARNNAAVQGNDAMKARGAKMDVWSLGVLAYELLTGSVPFRGTNPHDQQRVASTQGTLIVPRGVRPLPPSAIGLLRGTLRADPSHRFGPAEIARDAYLQVKCIGNENGNDNNHISSDVRTSPLVPSPVAQLPKQTQGTIQPNSTSLSSSATRPAAAVLPVEMDRNSKGACLSTNQLAAPRQHLSWSPASCRKVQHALACARAVALLADRSTFNLDSSSKELLRRSRGDVDGENRRLPLAHQHKVIAALYLRALKMLAAAYNAAEASAPQARQASSRVNAPTSNAAAVKSPLLAHATAAGSKTRAKKRATLTACSIALPSLASELHGAMTALHSEIENKAARSVHAATQAASQDAGLHAKRAHAGPNRLTDSSNGTKNQKREDSVPAGSASTKHHFSNASRATCSPGTTVDYNGLALQHVVAAAHQSARSGHLMELRGRDSEARCCLKVAALLFAVPLLPPSSVSPTASGKEAPAGEAAAPSLNLTAAAPSLDLTPEEDPFASSVSDEAKARLRDAAFLRAAARICDERYEVLNRAP